MRDSTPLCPTLQHICRRSSHNTSSRFVPGHVFPANRRVRGWGAGVVARAQRAAGLRADDVLHAGLQFAGLVRSLRPMPRTRLLALPSLLLALVLAACGAAAAPPTPTPRARSRPAPRSTSRASCAPRATSARTSSTPPARSCARTTPRRRSASSIDKGLAESDETKTHLQGRHRAVAGREGRRVGRGRQPQGAGLRRASSRPRTPRRRRRRSTRASRDGGKVKERSYSGVDYQVDDEGVAAGIVGDFFTVGTEAEFKRTVKAQDGDSLAEAKRYESAIDGLEDDRIGSSTSTSSRSSSRR